MLFWVKLSMKMISKWASNKWKKTSPNRPHLSLKDVFNSMTVLLPPRNIAFMIDSCSSTDPSWLSWVSSLKYKSSFTFTKCPKNLFEYYTQYCIFLVELFDKTRTLQSVMKTYRWFLWEAFRLLFKFLGKFANLALLTEMQLSTYRWLH